MCFSGIALGVILLAVPLAAEAQRASTIWRIGLLVEGSAEVNSFRNAFVLGLRDLGLVEGQDIVIDQRNTGGQFAKRASLAAELVQLKVDVLVAHGSSSHEAKQAAGTIPVVFVAHPDPVGAGLVNNLARPGVNITGLSDFHSELAGKRLELLKEVVPSASRVAVLHAGSPVHRRQLKDTYTAARALGLTVLPFEVRGTDDIANAFTAMVNERASALNVLGAPIFSVHGRQIADLAVKTRLPTISTTRRMADVGLLMSYGANFEDLYRRAATYVAKILRGANPADLPVEQPTRFDLVINLKTAEALGITLPPSLLIRANETIRSPQ